MFNERGELQVFASDLFKTFGGGGHPVYLHHKHDRARDTVPSPQHRHFLHTRGSKCLSNYA